MDKNEIERIKKEITRKIFIAELSQKPFALVNGFKVSTN